MIWILSMPTADVSAIRQATLGGIAVVIRLKASPFNPRTAKIMREKGGWLFVNGRHAWGSPDGIPESRLSSFEVTIGRKPIKVNPSLWNDLFNVHLDADSLHVEVNSRTKSIRLQMDGSDGYGAYQATWRIDRNGRVTRTVRGTN